MFQLRYGTCMTLEDGGERSTSYQRMYSTRDEAEEARGEAYQYYGAEEGFWCRIEEICRRR